MLCRFSQILAVVFFLSSCSITQNIEPSRIPDNSELCIIENSDVREGFLNEFRLALNRRGLSYRVIPESAVPESCSWTATYVARWKWDLALYMAYAEIRIFHNGSLDGEAKYDATNGSGNMGKFIDAEAKIRELLNALFPAN